jgi:hypothetical protein
MNAVPNQRTSQEGLEGYSFGELNSLWRMLDTDQRAFITLYYERSRKLNQQATEAFSKRQERLQFLLAYCKANRYTEHNTREKIINDWVFNDANDDWLRFSREVRRCQVAIDTELKMATLLALEVRVAG